MSRFLCAMGYMRERFEKDEKYFTVYDDYTPDLKTPVLTRKFYSKYEVMGDDLIPDPVLMENINKAKYSIPRERYPWPVTENQRYGWYTELLVPIDRSDKRYFAPRQSSDFIRHELELKRHEAVLPKVKFGGIPFKVQ